ncbi:inverse autotransporter beta domain-containing protein [Citrobacter freundii]|uniref:inverse autotransporter beta domain-containing protein n=1 Tax=Citrobacter freundii TaxID=546 RepID=UPI0015EA9831|nr:inverse autotransporter beta domain-containing protein [Citrobacter freundii]QLR74062.1 inverse autotransporter beta domain-containing protein [Citrobacter freundii]
MDSVAAKFNMSTDALKRLNQLRTFSRGFNALQAGDELDVPLTPFPEIAWGENDPLPSVDNEREKNIAGIASRAGSFLANNPDTDAAVALGNSMATTAASSEVQELLNRFGTARVQLETDKKLSLKNSQLDLLVPLYDRGDRVVFTQGSLHRTDDRNQSNLGVGIRHFISDYMLGVNTFGDYDLSREHARAGIGAEYWRDFVKLSANGYFRLTGWKDSPDVRDYDERPANGWDVRTQGWLPFAPQLGGKLTWEQYYGKDVALFGKNNRQRNPFAVTAGLEYTPIPLLSLNAEQRQGQSGKNDTRMGIGFNYQLGMPWNQQIDPSSVAAMRSLAGSRYDLVDRNNNIVLEYRQQEVLRISLPDVTEARSSELIRIPVTLHKDKYGLKETQWTSSPGFVEQGGTLQKRSEREIDVRIPAYTQGTRSGAAQEYTLTAVSFDNKGNRSNTASTIIRVSPSHHEMGELVVTPKSPVVADNSKFVSLTAAVNDESGLGVPGQQLTFSVSGLTDENNNPSATLYTDTQSNSKVLSVTTDADGKGTVMLRSKVAKKGSVTVTTDDGSTREAQVLFAADANTAMISGLNVTKNHAHADGLSSNEIEAVVLDAQGNPLANFTVEADADNDGVVDTSLLTDAKGKTTLKITNERAGETNVAVRSGAATRAALSTTVHFVVDKSAAHIAEGDLRVTAGAKANGMDSNAVTIKVTDTRGNIAGGVIVDISAVGETAEATVTADTFASNDEGLVNAIIRTQTAGEYKVNASIRESGSSTDTTTHFIADQDSANITDSNLTVASGAKADGQAGNTVVALVTDAQGNPVAKADVTFTADNTGASFAPAVVTTGDDGKASTTLTSTVAGKIIVTATVGNNAASKETAFIADRDTANITDSNLSVTSGAKADGQAGNAVVALVTDAQGNPVAKAEVTFTADNTGATFAPAVVTTGDDGRASTTLTSTVAGKIIVTATVGNNAASKETAFIADRDTANITDSNLTVASGAKADGLEGNAVVALVTDAQGNPVAKAEVTFTADNTGASFAPAVVTTGDDGRASTTLTSTVAGKIIVTATVGNNAASKETAFVVGEAAFSRSEVAVDKDTYTSGDDVVVTVTLNDEHGNAVINQVDKLSSSTVDVNNATIKEGSSWQDEGRGKYIATFTAVKVTSSATAKLQLSDWDTGVTSLPYSIVAGEPVASTSTLTRNANGYLVNQEMIFTLILRDGNRNVVRMDPESVLSDATFKTPGSDTVINKLEMNSNGSYSFTITASVKGEDLQASFRLNGWASDIVTTNYDVMPVFRNVRGLHSRDTNMGLNHPKEGFYGAQFVLDLQGGGDRTDYNWRTNADWATVDGSGVVMLKTTIASHQAREVTVTATPKNGKTFGIIRHTFKLDRWISVYDNEVFYPDALEACASLNMRLPADARDGFSDFWGTKSKYEQSVIPSHIYLDSVRFWIKTTNNAAPYLWVRYLINGVYSGGAGISAKSRFLCIEDF